MRQNVVRTRADSMRFSEAVLQDSDAGVQARVKLAYGRIFNGEFAKMLTDDFRLSPREVEICLLACKGVPLSRVADALGITEATARTHRRHVRLKLGVSRPEQLICKLFLARVGGMEMSL